jgi:hypothetical protein
MLRMTERFVDAARFLDFFDMDLLREMIGQSSSHEREKNLDYLQAQTARRRQKVKMLHC